MIQNNVLLLVMFLLWSIVANAQLSGTVVDRTTQQPISAVTITGKGVKSVTTDPSGKFSISSIGSDVTIRFRHLSYVDTMIFINTDNIHERLIVQLTSMPKEIEEVVVNTGYQQISKHRLTGAVSTVSRGQLDQQISRGLTTMLPAIASGVMMDNNSDFSGRIMVRGVSTIRGEKKPLIILDNFPYEGNIDDINPLDIETVSVLKDASASAIWGVRAGNGVIVVTTKKGKYAQKQNFSFSSSFKTGAQPDLNRLDIMSSKEFIEHEEYLFDMGYYDSRIDDYSKPPLTPIVEALDRLRNEDISQSAYDALRSRLATIDVRDGYREHFYRRSMFQQHHLQGSGGTERFSWISSLGYDRDISYNKNKSDRLTYRLQNQVKLLPDLHLSSDMNMVYQGTNFGKPAFGDIKMATMELYPYAEFADAGGIPTRIAQQNQDYVNEIGERGALLDWNYYPLLDHRYVSNTGKQWVFNWNLGLKYNLAEYLSLDLKYNLMLDRSHSERLHGLDSYKARDMINSFSRIDDNGSVIYNIPKGAILDRSNSQQLAHNGRAQLDFDRSYGDHDIAALLGFEGRINRTNGDGDILYGYNPDNLSFANVDYVTQFPNFTTGALYNISNSQYRSESDVRFVSVFANAVYSYKKRFNLSGSLRRDATNLFGLRTNKKWNLLWSLGGSWKIIEGKEHLFNSLNIRSTYGFSGNVDPTMSAVNTIRYMGTNTKLNLPIAMFSSYANPDLKWEAISALNLGADLKLLHNKLDMSIDWYRKTGKDLFGLDINDPTAGIGPTIVKNVASMKADGIDVSIDFKAIHTPQWKLQLQANMTRNEDEVTKYYLRDNRGRNFINERAISGQEGRPVYSLYSYKWKGLDGSGNPIGYLDGHESADYAKIFNNTQIGDMEYAGPVIPRWFGSGGAVLSYRDFSFNFRLLYKLGHSIRTRSIDYDALLSSNITHSDYARRWQQEGDENSTTVPSFAYPINSNRGNYYKYSHVLVESASHVRLQYVNLQYSPSKRINEMIRYSLSVNVENLGVLWKATKKEIDPDYENSYNGIAPPRQWALGVRLHF